MTDPAKETAGIWQKHWVAGSKMARIPLTQIGEVELEVTSIGSAGCARVDRLAPLPGLCNRFRRLQIGFDWPDLRERNQLLQMRTLASTGQPCDVVIFKQIVETFDGDGSTSTFFLRNRPVFEDMVSGSGSPWDPEYEPRVTLFSSPYTADQEGSGTELTVVEKTHSMIDIGAPAAGEAWMETDGRFIKGLLVSELRIASDSIPSDNFDVLRVVYVPMPRVEIGSAQRGRYGAAGVEALSWTMTQVF